MGLLDRIFGKDQHKEGASGPMTPQLAMDIVSAYGETMEAGGPIPGIVADVRELPYPKSRIKEALQLAMTMTTDKQMREHLVQGYVSLADYQEGVGRKRIGIDSTNADVSGEIHARAKEVVEQGNAYKKWEPIVDAEFKESFAELRKLGLLEGLD